MDARPGPEPVPSTGSAQAQAGEALRRHWGRVVAAAVRVCGDLGLAEEAAADAFALALQIWPAQGVPRSVEAWLLTVARRRAVDRVRRAAVGRDKLRLAVAGAPTEIDEIDLDDPLVADDDVRLVVLCCHPALDQEVQVALTLRLACGVPTAAVAAAFLVPESTMAARLTRAKQRIARSELPITLPDDLAVEERMPAVLRTVLLAYSMGHTAGAGATLRDDSIAGHAVHLARTIHHHRPDDPEAAALHALVVLCEARAGGRLAGDGAQVLLEHADRSAWDHTLIVEGLAAIRANRRPSAHSGPMALRAELAALHAAAPRAAETDWTAIVEVYDLLLAREPSPTVAIGRCLAIAELCGPAAGLADLDEVLAVAGQALRRYPYAAAARARLLAAGGERARAADAWRDAAAWARTDAERAYFLEQAGAAADAASGPR